MTVMAI